MKKIENETISTVREKKSNIKKIKLTMLIIIVSAFFASLYKVNVIDKVNKNNEKEEIKKEISYEIYHYINPELKIMVTVEDTENGIEKVEYPNNELTLNCNGKNKVGIDYVIDVDKVNEFTFTATNTLGEKIEKTINVGDIAFNELIGTNIVDETETQKIITVNYQNGSTIKQYKISETGSWENY